MRALNHKNTVGIAVKHKAKAGTFLVSIGFILESLMNFTPAISENITRTKNPNNAENKRRDAISTATTPKTMKLPHPRGKTALH